MLLKKSPKAPEGKKNPQNLKQFSQNKQQNPAVNPIFMLWKIND